MCVIPSHLKDSNQIKQTGTWSALHPFRALYSTSGNETSVRVGHSSRVHAAQ